MSFEGTNSHYMSYCACATLILLYLKKTWTITKSKCSYMDLVGFQVATSNLVISKDINGCG